MGPVSRASRRNGPEPAACRDTFRLLAQSTPAEFVQTIVVDAEMMSDLVDHRDRHLVDDFSFAVTHLQQRFAVDGDGVRQRPRPVPRVSLCQRDALVQAEYVGLLGVAIRDQNDDVVDRRGELGGIRSSASETSSSNRCGFIRTATRLLPWRRERGRRRGHGLGRRRQWPRWGAWRRR